MIIEQLLENSLLILVFDFRLVPVLEPWAEDMENSTDKTSTLCSSLATVMLKTFSTKDPKTLSIIEKIPTFLLKEKKRDKIKIIKDKLKIRGHHFEKKYFDQVIYERKDGLF